METFSQETRREVAEAFNGYCCVKDCLSMAVDHHHKLPNSKYCQEKFPLFLQSVLNDAPVCRYHHDNSSQHGELNIRDEVAEVYENYLKKIYDLGIDEGGY